MTKKMPKILSILSLALLLAGLGSAADKKHPMRIIEGRIVDSEGRALPEVEVYIPQIQKKIITDTNGRFRLELSFWGKIHFEIFKIGFLAVITDPVKDLISQKITLPPITMERSVMEEIVITGTGTKKIYREAPVKTFVATKKAIENRGATTLADSLEIVTGVRVENDCGNCNFNQVRINGMDGKYSQILINGMPVVSSLAGVYILEQISSNMVETLEVVKGGGSSLYGGNAVAGVVNIILKEPSTSGSQFLLRQGFMSGSTDTDISFSQDYVRENSFFNLSAGFKKREELDYNKDGFSDTGRLSNLNLMTNFSQSFKRINGKLRINLGALYETRRGGNKLDLPEHQADIAESIKTLRMDLGMNWEQAFSSTSLLRLSGGYTYTRRDSYYGAFQDPNAYGLTTNPVYFGELTYYNFDIKNHEIISGISFRSDRIDDMALAYGRRIQEVYNDVGVYLQDEIQLLKDFKVLLGGRLDKHSEVDSIIFSPRTSIVYTGIENMTVRGTFSTGFRAPQVFDEDLHITQVGGLGKIIRNCEGLGVEKSTSITLGIDFGRQVKNKLFQFSLGGFYTRLKDVFTLENISQEGNALVFERFNSAGAKVYGLEFELGFKIGRRFEIFSGWTWQKSIYDEPEPDFDSRVFFRTPDFYGFLRLEASFKGFFNVHGELSYTGPMKAPHYAGYIPENRLETTPEFFVINLSVTREIGVVKGKEIKLVLAADNLLDSFQQDLDRGVYKDAGYVYGPRFPRKIRLGMQYHF